MRCVVQRVDRASVSVGGEVVGRCGRGLLVLAAFAPGDTDAELSWMARKLVGLRIFRDAADRMNLALADVDGGILLVSQFTLYGDCRRGNRPGFTGSAPPDRARELYDRFAEILSAEWPRVEQGRFGAQMDVELLNQGPVTLVIDREHRTPDPDGRSS